jgi:hypothetical protein
MIHWDRLFRHRKRMMEDLDQDIRDYVERETQDNIERGLPPEEARYAALRKSGSHGQCFPVRGLFSTAISKGNLTSSIGMGHATTDRCSDN